MSIIGYELKKELPVTHEADVVVVGGGPGGLGAAVMAARAGAKVLLVERFGHMGGMASVGEVHPFMVNHFRQKDGERGQSFDRPVYTEWVERMHTYHAPGGRWSGMEGADGNGKHDLQINKDIAALAAEDLCLEAGVKLLFHHSLADVIVKNRKIEALVLFSKSGFTAVKGKMYVDCSGDADLAARAGCECEFGGESGFCQPMTLCFKLYNVNKELIPWKEMTRLYNEAKERGEIECPRENVLMFHWFTDDVMHFNTTRVIKHSGINGSELSDAEILARKQLRQLIKFLREKVAGFEKAELHSMASHIGIRETRRVRGLAYVTREDFVNRKKFPDAIAQINYPIDIHNPNGTGTELIHMKGDEWYEIPFGSVVAKDIDNLLVGGRPISVDHAVHSSARVMPPACTVGQAAGVGAALAAAGGVAPKELDGVKVRAKLKEMGAHL